MDGQKIVNNTSVGGLIQRTLNRVDARLVDHGIRVAFIVSEMLRFQGKYPPYEQELLCLTAMLHDIGAYKTEEIDKMVQFECEGVWEHAIYGFLFLKYLSPLGDYADAVLYHHATVDQLKAVPPQKRELAQLIHLADRVDIFWQSSQSREKLLAYLKRGSGRIFYPEIIRLFLHTEQRCGLLARLDRQHSPEELLKDIANNPASGDEFLKMLIYSIDFRSSHTVTHTITTTFISYETARIMGLPPESHLHIYYGAMLHDLGEIGIPVEILEYPGKLSPQAMTIMRTHVDITEQILDGCIDPVTTRIALRHHEKLDGSGYPRGLTADQMTIEEQIVAVADIISALLGTRSYKAAFSRERTLSIIKEQAHAGKINAQIVQTISEHFDDILAEVQRHCEPIIDSYQGIQAEYVRLLDQFHNQ